MPPVSAAKPTTPPTTPPTIAPVLDELFSVDVSIGVDDGVVTMVSVTTELLMEMVRTLVCGLAGAAEVCKVVGSGDDDLVETGVEVDLSRPSVVVWATVFGIEVEIREAVIEVGLSVDDEGGGAVELLTLADDVGAEPP